MGITRRSLGKGLVAAASALSIPLVMPVSPAMAKDKTAIAIREWLEDTPVGGIVTVIKTSETKWFIVGDAGQIEGEIS